MRRRLHPNGYVLVRIPGHPRASVSGYVLEHVIVAEKALGRGLPAGSEVHHANEDRTDNRPENLVICESTAYHALLHIRMRALAACGHVDWLRCSFCGRWAPESNLYVQRRPDGRIKRSHHRSCNAAHQRRRRSL